jgi:hypothetical protein
LFEQANPFVGGYAAVRINGMWGILSLEKLLDNSFY